MTPSKMQTSPTGEMKLARSIGLSAGVAIVIGGVIGIGIYTLVAEIGVQAGNATWLSLCLAFFLSVIGVVPLIQLASAMPRAGGGYLFTSRLMSPLAGWWASQWAVLGGACVSALVSLGLAGYIAQYIPGTPVRPLALCIPVAFFIIYLFGVRLAAWLQMLMAAQLVLALLFYAVFGAFHVAIRFSFSSPKGMGGILMAVILSYTVCLGLQVIAEMGEEMVDARKNIPLSILLGGIVVLVIYVLIGNTFISSVPYNPKTIGSMTAPLLETGRDFMPAPLLPFLSLGALSAGLTSLNAAALAIPREIFSQARDGLVPRFLGRVDTRTQSPLTAVAAYFIMVEVLLLLGQDLDFYGYMTAVGILLMTALISIAAMRLPKVFPERYLRSYFRVPKGILVIVAVLAVLSSMGFVLLVFSQLPVAFYIYLAWTLAVGLWYTFRVKWLKGRGFPWEQRTRELPGEDEQPIPMQG